MALKIGDSPDQTAAFWVLPFCGVSFNPCVSNSFHLDVLAFAAIYVQTPNIT
jgi:hypothetical protein